MQTKTFIKILLWVICLIGVIDVGCSFVSMADTILNIVGVVLMATFAFVSYKTKCFTYIKIKK
jgi:hypothetical protein